MKFFPLLLSIIVASSAFAVVASNNDDGNDLMTTIDYREYIHCPENPDSSRYIRNPYDCRSFYRCYKEGFVRLAIWNCPDGEYFDDDLVVHTCIRIDDYLAKYGQCKTIPLPTIKPPTEKPTTRPSTKQTTRPTTRSTTEKTTRPTTRPTTEKTTRPTTRPTTEKTTRPTTRPTTEKTTRPTTRSTTEKPTRPSTRSTTEKPTRPSTRSTTEKPTRPSTRPTTEKPTRPSTRPTMPPTTKRPHHNDYDIWRKIFDDIIHNIFNHHHNYDHDNHDHHQDDHHHKDHDKDHDKHHDDHHHKDDKHHHHHEEFPLELISDEEKESLLRYPFENVLRMIIEHRQIESTIDEKQIDYRKLIQCPSNPDGQRHRNPFDCNRFYLCYKQNDQTQLALYNCPDGAYFDDTVTVQTCILRSDFEKKYGQCKTRPLPHDDDDDDDKNLVRIFEKILKKIEDFLERKHREYEDYEKQHRNHH
uniref:Uncharacterized protein LOC113798279 isoform X1 n=1 Tax=Dermatophagoides pteronyssinus TaxID=6956 RepID=A0A6P6YGH2_DERPT|nr:uncharacterized protein LOC113798279 isoform X1 [Dermatophagoides pteronyssinus]